MYSIFDSISMFGIQNLKVLISLERIAFLEHSLYEVLVGMCKCSIILNICQIVRHTVLDSNQTFDIRNLKHSSQTDNVCAMLASHGSGSLYPLRDGTAMYNESHNFMAAS